MMDGLNPFPNEDFIRKAAIAISFFLRAALKDRLKKGKKTNPKKPKQKHSPPCALLYALLKSKVLNGSRMFLKGSSTVFISTSFV